MPRVIIDTNFFLIPGRFGVDIFSEIRSLVGHTAEFAVMEGTAKELAGIARTAEGKDRKALRLSSMLIKAKGLKTLTHPPETDVDTAILEAAGQNDHVATQDLALRKRLREKGIKVIFLRQKRYLRIDG